MVFLEVALVIMNRNWPASASLIESRILLVMVPCGMVSEVVTKISLWTGGRELLKKRAGFLLFGLVAVWKGVSLALAAV